MNDPSVTRPEKHSKTGPSFGVLAVCLILAIVVVVLGVKVHRLNAQAAANQEQLAGSKADAAKVQAELDKAKTQSGDLQAQLDKAKAQSTDLQAQLDQSKSAATQAQALLDKAKSQSVDLQAQLDKAKAQSADFESQLHQATAGSTQLLTQLDQAKIQTMDLQSRLQKAEGDLAQLQPMLLKARHMPVTTSLEKVHGGRNFTLHINNLYLQPLNLTIAITGAGKTRSQSNIVGAGATLDVEKVAAGETAVISSDGYDPVNVTAQ
jgi:septal ring factor EnvC (AmiA/AmiB activator)